MKKFIPAITIWTVGFTDKNDGTLLGQEYFLSYRRAKKRREELLKDAANYSNENISLGGEPLWLW